MYFLLPTATYHVLLLLTVIPFELLLDKGLMRKVDEFPWLATALKRDVC